jgi:hypothetical protein
MDSVVKVSNPCSDIFDADAGWRFMPEGQRQSLKIFPNDIAYRDRDGILALIVKRSPRGDFAEGEEGMAYLERTRELTTGEPVTSAFVVYAVFDPNAGNAKRLKVFRVDTYEKARERSACFPLQPGKRGTGDYRWIVLPEHEDERPF